MLNPHSIRADFPIFAARERSGEPFIYLDNAATTQKPQAVIDALCDYYGTTNANVHRSPHRIGMEATERFEGARVTVSRFLNATEPAELIFTRGTTEAINLAAGLLAGQVIGEGDVILCTPSEHHSNLIPWQMAAQRIGARLEFVTLQKEGRFDLDEIAAQWHPQTKVFAFQHASNVLGTIHPVADLCRMARERGAVTVVDGAQAAPHLKVDVQELGCDFYAMSAHKICGPTGIGALYGRREWLDRLNPIWGGGEMILKVSLTSATYNEIPFKFEPGTPNIAGAVGFGAAIEYMEGIGMGNVAAYLDDLAAYAYDLIKDIDGVTVFGPREGRTGAISFWVEGVHPHDIASFLDADGISVRAGHHCAQPLMQWLDLPATARASFYIYNTRDEADELARSIVKTRKVMGIVA
ncbi:MAG: SufS family cysteine desulfurase [Calditrichaeota bacterium]|nr:SufS family cysteine desulfurase [Calditrichota bacterium]